MQTLVLHSSVIDDLPYQGAGTDVRDQKGAVYLWNGSAYTLGGGADTTAIAPSNLSVAIAKTVGGVSDTRILLLGDSTTRGRGATPGTQSISALLALRLAKLFAVPVIDNFICPEATGRTDDIARISLGAGWVGSTGYGFGNDSVIFNNSNATTTTLTYSSGFSDKIRIYYTPYPGGPGTFTPTVNGVAKTVQSMAGAVGISVYEATYTRAAAATVAIAVNASPVLITGIEFIDTTQKCIYIANAGVSGATAATMLTAGSYSTAAMLAAYAPNHTMLNLGINDSVLNVPTATWSANMRALITALQVYGSVDLWKFFQTSPSLNAFVPVRQPAYYSELEVIADALGCTVLDLYTASGGYTYMGSKALMADEAHPNAGGYAMGVPTLANRFLAL